MRLTLYDKVVDFLWMTKAAHIFFEFALLLCAFSQPKCLDTHFHLLRKHLSVPISRSVGTIKKSGWETSRGFFFHSGFRSSPLTKSLETDYKNIQATPMAASVEELDATSKKTCDGLPWKKGPCWTNSFTLHPLLCRTFPCLHSLV